ncbi:MAG: enoyl-CoA hydratase-related protein [Bacteroidetes bacterium]|nr:enoyl-CoA hydratase-related protein [Bacteroidota bacterium]
MNNIKFEIQNQIGIIRFNRPEVLNSFTIEMSNEFAATLNTCSEDKNIRAIYLTGNGRGFCAGQDINEFLASSQNEIHLGEILKKTYEPIILKIREIEKPIVCGVNGVAAGAGANIALACDFVVASEKASFIQSFSKIGLIPDAGGSFFLPRLVGFSKATELLMLADKVLALDAEKIGMIYKCVPGNLLEEVSLKLAERLSKMPTKAIGYIKKLMNESFSNNLQNQLSLEAKLQELAGFTKDFKEGINSFLEKRNPNFTGE